MCFLAIVTEAAVGVCFIKSRMCFLTIFTKDAVWVRLNTIFLNPLPL